MIQNYTKYALNQNITFQKLLQINEHYIVCSAVKCKSNPMIYLRLLCGERPPEYDSSQMWAKLWKDVQCIQLKPPRKIGAARSGSSVLQPLRRGGFSWIHCIQGT